MARPPLREKAMTDRPPSIPAELMELEARPKIIGARGQRLEGSRPMTGPRRPTDAIRPPPNAHGAFRPNG